MRNIAIMSSHAGSGKDTVANIILNSKSTNRKYIKLGLGDKIHEVVNGFNNISSNRRSTRSRLQLTGEYYRRIFGEDIWIRYAEQRMRKLSTKSNINFIIPDVRKIMEFSHFCIENDCYPLYISIKKQIAYVRVDERDNEVDTRALDDQFIESQMLFIEDLPRQKVGKNGLSHVALKIPSVLNKVYILDNNGSLEQLRKQIDDWKELTIDAKQR